MEIRFALNRKLDKNLIARIEQKANGGSTNEATRFLLRFWHEQELRQEMTLSGRKLPSEGQITSSEGETGEVNLSGLDSINLEI